MGTTDATGQVFSSAGSSIEKSRYAAVSTNTTFAGDFTVLSTWKKKKIVLGIAFGDDLSPDKFTGTSSDANGPAGTAWHSSAFNFGQGQDTSDAAAWTSYQSAKNGGYIHSSLSETLTEYWMKHQRSGNTLTISTSTSADAAEDVNHITWVTHVTLQAATSSVKCIPAWYENDSTARYASSTSTENLTVYNGTYSPDQSPANFGTNHTAAVWQALAPFNDPSNTNVYIRMKAAGSGNTLEYRYGNSGSVGTGVGTFPKSIALKLQGAMHASVAGLPDFILNATNGFEIRFQYFVTTSSQPVSEPVRISAVREVGGLIYLDLDQDGKARDGTDNAVVKANPATNLHLIRFVNQGSSALDVLFFATVLQEADEPLRILSVTPELPLQTIVSATLAPSQADRSFAIDASDIRVGTLPSSQPAEATQVWRTASGYLATGSTTLPASTLVSLTDTATTIDANKVAYGNAGKLAFTGDEIEIVNGGLTTGSIQPHTTTLLKLGDTGKKWDTVYTQKLNNGADLTLPSAHGNIGQLLETGANGMLSWVDAPSGGGDVATLAQQVYQTEQPVFVMNSVMSNWNYTNWQNSPTLYGQTSLRYVADSVGMTNQLGSVIILAVRRPWKGAPWRQIYRHDKPQINGYVEVQIKYDQLRIRVRDLSQNNTDKVLYSVSTKCHLGADFCKSGDAEENDWLLISIWSSWADGKGILKAGIRGVSNNGVASTSPAEHGSTRVHTLVEERFSPTAINAGAHPHLYLTEQTGTRPEYGWRQVPPGVAYLSFYLYPFEASSSSGPWHTHEDTQMLATYGAGENQDNYNAGIPGMASQFEFTAPATFTAYESPFNDNKWT